MAQTTVSIEVDYEVQARSATCDLWVRSAHPGEPKYGPMLLPDGRDVHDLVAAGAVAELPFTPRFVAANDGKRWGDLLWSTGGNEKLASNRLVTALHELGLPFQTFEVDLAIPRLEGTTYVGLAATSEDPPCELYNWNGHIWSVGMSGRVLLELQSRGAAGVDFEPLPDPLPRDRKRWLP